MTGREKREAIWQGGHPDCFTVHAGHFWIETLERWHREGLPAEMSPCEYLGLTDSDCFNLPVHAGFAPQFDVRVLSQDDRHVILCDECGVTKKMMRGDYERTKGMIANAGLSSSMSEWIEYPVKDIASWKKVYHERMRPSLEGRVSTTWKTELAQLREQAKMKTVHQYSFPLLGTLGAVRQLMGLENMCYAFYDDPQLIHSIMEDLVEFWEQLFTPVLQDIQIDCFVFFEDMCSNRSPLVSPAQFNTFFAPSYRRFNCFLKERGVTHIELDSDGCCLDMIPSWLDCGIEGISPLQVSAKMDAQQLREQYPKLSLRGGLDKTALARGKQEIYDEVKRRFTTAWHMGGYIPELDHLIPPDVSWDHYQYYIECVRKFSEPFL